MFKRRTLKVSPITRKSFSKHRPIPVVTVFSFVISRVLNTKRKLRYMQQQELIIMSLGRFQHSPMARVGIFILLNNSHYYTLVEECTIDRTNLEYKN
jgi:hypothetical protein